MPFESILFFFLAFVAVLSAILMVTRRNPINSALYLILNFIALAGLYLTLKAQFVAIIQILVYTGAIMVLVLFVIMLLNLQDEERLKESRTWRQYTGIVLAGFLVVALVNRVGFASSLSLPSLSSKAASIGTIENVGTTLYTGFLLPFELASLLLLAAIIGAVVLAKKRFP